MANQLTTGAKQPSHLEQLVFGNTVEPGQKLPNLDDVIAAAGSATSGDLPQVSDSPVDGKNAGNPAES
jgi:hypothetical protein